MKETSIVPLLKANWRGVLLERIESVAGSGTPDLNCVYKGQEFWVELKVLTSDGSFQIRPAQIAWHVRRLLNGLRGFVLARNESELHLFMLKSPTDTTWLEIFCTRKPFDYGELLCKILENRVYID